MALRRFLALAALLLAAPLHAQSTGTVRGRALAADGAPVPLSVVRILPGGRTTLTDAQGAFRFDTVAPGSYRLQMERIGYTAPPSAEFAVAAGETREHTLRAALKPVVLEAVSNGRPACYTRDRLAEAPAVQTLWREAAKGVEQRRAFARQYAYRYTQHSDGVAHLRLLRDRRIIQDTVVHAHPDSMRVRLERINRRGGALQSRNSPHISLPTELYLLRDDFLVGHCLEANPQRDSAGVWALRFRAVRAPSDSLTLAGTLRLHERTFNVQAVEFQYMEGRREWAVGRVDYGEVATPFGTLRLPRGGWVRSSRSGMLVTRFQGRFEFQHYRDFERVGG